jgi:hypothetical protein
MGGGALGTEGPPLPHLSEYLLCLDFGWTWQEIQATPADVLAYWLVYRNVRLQVERAGRE